MLIVETENSTYRLRLEDPPAYQRSPKVLQTILSSRLVYEIWHPMLSYEFHNSCNQCGWLHLHLWKNDSIDGISTSELISVAEELPPTHPARAAQ